MLDLVTSPLLLREHKLEFGNSPLPHQLRQYDQNEHELKKWQWDLILFSLTI